MGLDRDELAARCLASMLSCSGRTGRASDYAEDAVDAADALLSALSPPAAVAPAPYEPKVGDVVRYAGGACGMAGALKVLIAPDKDSTGGSWRAYSLSSDGPTGQPIPTDARWWTYIRPATPAERAAAGLPATPAPEAKRPTHVRVTGPKDTRNATIGKVYEVLHFDADRDRLIIRGDDGLKWGLSNKPGESSAFPTWEPCDAPAPTPPAPSREEALKACVDALVDVRDRLSVSQRLDLRPTIDAALALARAATKGGA